mgnify:CR=1 FL=1
MSGLNGRYAVVTGGGKGIGASIVKRFVKEGDAGVAIFDYDETLARKTAEDVGGNILVCKCDVSKDDEVKAAVAQTLAAFGRIDILVNNAGITRDALFHKMTDEQWMQVVDVNLNGVYYCCKHIVPLMREQRYGKIVNISSSSAGGNAGQANYSATKAAVIGFTKSLAKELASKGITSNAITPAMIDTEMMRSVPEHLLDIYLKAVPAGRFGTVDELAAAVYFLSSDDSSFVNGAVLPVNGGMFT